MSLIHDALTRNTPKDDDSPRGESHSDSVLATLGYARHHRPRKHGLSIKMLMVYGGAAAAIGFVGLSLLIAFFAPPEPPRPAAAGRVASRPAAPVATTPPRTAPLATLRFRCRLPLRFLFEQPELR